MDIEITDEALERVAKAMISEHNWLTGTDSNRLLALIQARRAWEEIEKIRNEDGNIEKTFF